MEVNMLKLKRGNYVSTPKDGIGNILLFTDYKPVEVEDHIEIKPTAAVVIFDDGSGAKYPLDQLAMAEKPQIQPSEPETAIA
jgi:hypothetical protein